MKEYTVIRCENPDWEQIPALEMASELFPREHTVKAWAQVCYDDSSLHLRLRAEESTIRAEHTGLLDEICEDSCLEFFFSPKLGDDRYFNVEFNPNGAMYLGFGRSLQSLQRLIPETPVIRPQVQRCDTGWSLTYSIPYSFIRLFFPAFYPTSGSTMKANFFKCGDLSPQPHWLCWNPVPAEVATFHCPAHFGLLRFA